jgi:hypothetical protein
LGPGVISDTNAKADSEVKISTVIMLKLCAEFGAIFLLFDAHKVYLDNI